MKKPLNEGVLDSTDDDGWMAKSQLYNLAKNATDLHKLISDSEELEPWVQSKIAKAEDYISSILTYMEYQKFDRQNQTSSDLSDTMSIHVPDGISYNPDADVVLDITPGADLEEDTDASMDTDDNDTLEGPYVTKSGKKMYFDPAMGKYWDPVTKQHISYSQWVNMNRSDNASNVNEKAKSKSQQRAAGIALAAKKGETAKSKLRGASKEMFKMSRRDLEDFAGTKHADLPDRVEEGTKKKTLRNTNPCWKGYEPVGTKKKNGKTVPNCVPVAKKK